MIRYANYLLYGQSALHSLTPQELIIAEKLMKGGFKLPNPNEVFAKKKAKKKRSHENASAAPDERRPPSVAAQSPSSHQAGSSHGATEEETDLITMSLPANSSIYSGAPNMLGFAESWLLPEDQCRYEGLGMSATADWAASRVMQVSSHFYPYFVCLDALEY